MLSLAHKRWAQNEADKIVLEGEVVAVELPETQALNDKISDRFLGALT